MIIDHIKLTKMFLFLFIRQYLKKAKLNTMIAPLDPAVISVGNEY